MKSSIRQLAAPALVAGTLSLSPLAYAQDPVFPASHPTPDDKTLLAEPIPEEEGLQRVLFFLPLFLIAYFGINSFRHRHHSRRDFDPHFAHSG